MSQTAITLAFEQWKAQQGATGEPVVLDEFVFASVPGLDPDVPIDRAEVLPPESQIVHRGAVSRKGVVNDNAVVHSVVLGADVGDFSFNWIGLINKASGTLAMIVHAPIQQKLKTAEGQQGNVLTRSFLMEYNGAQAETGINTPAETWQIDFTARMAGMDERQRLENADIYGAAAFFGDGYLVGKTGNQYFVTKGTGYVAGLRTSLAENQNITVTTKPVKVWLDVCWTGALTSVWNVQRKITVAENLADYVQNGVQHYVFAVASIDVNGNITDLRPKGALNEQQASDALKKHEQSRNHPDATPSEKGFTRLSSATDSDSEGLAATSKAVKIAMDNANARLAKDRNGADIPNPPLFVQNIGLKPTVDKAANAVDKNGDTMTGPLTIRDGNVTIETVSSDSPQYTIINTTTGAVVNIDLLDRVFRIFGSPWGGGPVKLFYFNLETGDVSIPGTFRAGSAALAVDGNIYGSSWGDGAGNGGWLYQWLTTQLVARDNNINLRAPYEWVNQNFVSRVQRGAQASMTMDGALVEAPAGCFLTGGNGNEGNQVGVALYRSLLINRNGVWVIIEN